MQGNGWSHSQIQELDRHVSIQVLRACIGPLTQFRVYIRPSLYLPYSFCVNYNLALVARPSLDFSVSSASFSMRLTRTSHVGMS